MVRKKSKAAPGKVRDPLPEHFNSLEAAAEFWDTHDSADYDDYFKEVSVAVDLKPRTHLVAIEGPLYDKVRAIAKKKRVATDKLVNRWLEEKAS
jgi:CopG antitoxin of type II toxin-antitoxin system